MARRQRRRVGDVLRVPLEDGQYAFAQVLDDPLIAFFDLKTRDPEPGIDEILSRPVAFRVWVMKYAVTSGDWPRIGHRPVDEGVDLPRFFKQDPITGDLAITVDGGDEEPATLEECSQLESAAVWEPEQIEERLRDHFTGRTNRWVEQLRPQDPDRVRSG